MTTEVKSSETVESLVASLRQAAEKVRAERQEWEQEVEAKRQQFDFREQMITQAAEGLNLAFGEIDFGKLPEDTRSVTESSPKLSISEKHLGKIEEYLQKHGRVRQADIVKDLKLNSGTVSVGLRRLELDHKIRKGEKQRGSQTWLHPEPVEDEQRETVVRPGEGVTEGRVAA